MVSLNEKPLITTQAIIQPNPSNGVFLIRSEKEKIKQVVVMDNLASKISSNTNSVNDNLMTINLSEYPKGIYFELVEIGNFFKTEKLIQE